MKRLIKALHFEGYGLFWAVAEHLHNNANKLAFDEIDLLADDLKVEGEKLRRVLFDFQLFTVKNEVISSKRVAKNFKIQKEKSKKARESAMVRWHGLKASSGDTDAILPHYEGNALKERKGKEKKEKENKKGKKKEDSALEYVKKLREEAGLAPPPEFFKGKEELARKLGRL